MTRKPRRTMRGAEDEWATQMIDAYAKSGMPLHLAAPSKPECAAFRAGYRAAKREVRRG